MKDRIRGIFSRSSVAIVEWCAHCVIVGAILLGIRLLHILIDFLWDGEEVTFFQVISLDELVFAFDFFLLVGILLLGVGAVIKAYREY